MRRLPRFLGLCLAAALAAPAAWLGAPCAASAQPALTRPLACCAQSSGGHAACCAPSHERGTVDSVVTATTVHVDARLLPETGVQAVGPLAGRFHNSRNFCTLLLPDRPAAFPLRL